MNGLMFFLLGLLGFGLVMNVIAWIDYRKRSKIRLSR